MSSILENVAKHDSEIYENIDLFFHEGVYSPRCPICGGSLVPSSNRESNNVWGCRNYNVTKSGQLVCGFIEAKFSKRQMMLWDCRYEPSFIFPTKRKP